MSLNILVSSKNKKASDNNSHFTVELKQDFVINDDEEAYISMSSFNIIKSFYAVQAGLNDQFVVKYKMLGVVTESHTRFITPGNYDVNTLMSEIQALLNGALFEISYDAKKNKFLFKNIFQLDADVYLQCINCGDLLGFHNGQETLIHKENGTYSDKFVNISGFTSMLLKIGGDIDLQNSVSNIQQHEFHVDKILGIVPIGDVAPMDMISYNDTTMAFKNRILNRKISSFDITISNENGDEFVGLDNWIMTLKIEKNVVYKQEQNIALYLHNIEFYLMSLYSYLDIPSRLTFDDVYTAYRR
jgi:hypothetical protein